MIDVKEVTVELSNWCPLNCIHCSTWYTPHYYNFDEYIIDTNNVINKTIDHVRSTPNIPIRIRFSGGDPLPFLSREIFEKMKNQCPNIVEWIITTSGAIPIIKLIDFVRQMETFKDRIVYRVSLYGNKKQHTNIVRNIICYDNSIATIEWLIKNKQTVELTTPIISFWHTFNVAMIARKYKISIRVAKLINTPAIRSMSQRRQLLIAKIIKILYNRIYLTCSLYGQCKTICDYPKSTVLATGNIIGCAIDKLSGEKKINCL